MSRFYMQYLHAISGEDFKLLKDILKAREYFESELAALRIQRRGTAAFIHLGINETSVW